MIPALSALTRDDVASTKELIAEVVLEFYADLEFLPKTKAGLLLHYEKTGYLDDLTAFEREYSRENGAFLVLKVGSQIVGCGGLRRLDASRGELDRLWLRKDFRGLGHGRLIFDRLIGLAKDIGYPEILLDTSNRCAAAVALFRKNGFAECGKYKESIGDLFMRRVMHGSSL